MLEKLFNELRDTSNYVVHSGGSPQEHCRTECTKIARFSAAAAAIFTAPPKIAIFRGPKMRDFLCEENR